MSKLTTALIAVIKRQSDVISKNLRDNFANIKAALNNNVDLMDAITSPVAGNQVTDGDFASVGSWVEGTGWSIASGTADKTAGTGSDLSQASVLTVGQSYSVTFTVSNYVAGTITPKCGTGAGTGRTADGTYSEEIVCAGNTSFILTADSSGDYTIDNVVVNGVEVQGSRPYHNSLSSRLNQTQQGQGNYTVDGGVVTINGVDTAKVDISAYRGGINGIDVDIDAGTSATITAATSTFHKLGVVVANSDNTFSIVEGAESLKASVYPVFPSIALSQTSLAVIYVDDTVTVNVTSEIRALKPDNFLPNKYFHLSTGATIDFMNGSYQFNNLIIRLPFQLQVESAPQISLASSTNYIFNCTGNVFIEGDITKASGTIVDKSRLDGRTGGEGSASADVAGVVGLIGAESNSLFSGNGGRGGTGGGAGSGVGGSGGAGGSSLVNVGGAGGSATAVTNSGNSDNGGNGGSGAPLLAFIGDDVTMAGDITLTGTVGNNGFGGVGEPSGGGGGGAGGAIVLTAMNDLTLDNSDTYDVGGGAGGVGGNSVAGEGASGGGGGAGGLILYTYKTLTNAATLVITGGAGGVGGTGGAGGGTGVVGQVGLSKSQQYDLATVGIGNYFMPLNTLNVNLLGMGNGKQI